MSRAHRWSLTRLGETVLAGSMVALVVVGELAGPRLVKVLLAVGAALASLADFDWPRWVHNLADLLQIITPLAAIMAWASTRRRRE